MPTTRAPTLESDEIRVARPTHDCTLVDPEPLSQANSSDSRLPTHLVLDRTRQVVLRDLTLHPHVSRLAPHEAHIDSPLRCHTTELGFDARSHPARTSLVDSLTVQSRVDPPMQRGRTEQSLTRAALCTTRSCGLLREVMDERDAAAVLVVQCQ